MENNQVSITEEFLDTSVIILCLSKKKMFSGRKVFYNLYVNILQIGLRYGAKSPRKEILHHISPEEAFNKKQPFNTSAKASIRMGDWKLITGYKGTFSSILNRLSCCFGNVGSYVFIENLNIQTQKSQYSVLS